MADNSTGLAILLYKQGKFNEAFPLFKEASKYGESEASHYLGKCFVMGRGVQLDPVESLFHFQTAANAGCEGAFEDYCKALIIAVDLSPKRYFPTELTEHFKNKSQNNQEFYIQLKNYFEKELNKNETKYQVIYSLFLYFGIGTIENKASAENLLKEASNHQDIEATYLLGKLFNHIDSLITAANQNHPQACVDLGIIFISGTVVPKNHDYALKWYKKASDLGHAAGSFYLASNYFIDSKGQNHPEMIRLMKISADLGYPRAIHNYGVFLEMGESLPQDNKLAYQYYKRGAELGVPESLYKVGHCLFHGKGIDKSPEEALEYFRKAADLKNREAAFNYAIALETGVFIQKDSSEAAKYYSIAASLGISEALVNLVNLYDCGKGVTQDSAIAAKLYLQAADTGNVLGLHNYAFMLENGRGVPKNELQAIQLYKIAADLGEPRAMFNHANSLFHGRGFPQNIPEAAKYYKMSADHGFNHGMMNTAIAYMEGRGFPQDYVKAMEYFKKALASGISEAQKGIDCCLANIKKQNESS